MIFHGKHVDRFTILKHTSLKVPQNSNTSSRVIPIKLIKGKWTADTRSVVVAFLVVKEIKQRATEC
jgi:hypothetical protein